MKRVEFLARFTDQVPKTEEEINEEKTNEIIGKAFGIKEKKKITYDPLNVDMEEVDEYLRYDKEHTNINMRSGKTYCVRIPYEDFSSLYQELMGVSVFVISYTPIKEI